MLCGESAIKRVFKERTLQEEEGKNQSGFPICPFGTAYSALPDTHCTSSTLTSIKADEEWKSGREAYSFPHLVQSVGWTEQEKGSTSQTQL